MIIKIKEWINSIKLKYREINYIELERAFNIIESNGSVYIRYMDQAIYKMKPESTVQDITAKLMEFRRIAVEFETIQDNKK